MMNNSLAQIIQRKDENIVVTNLGNEMVMMNLESGNYITLNNLGSIIWEKIKEPIKVSDLINYLLSKYKVTESQCKEETFIFLEKLKAEGLID
ncbi:lasso peptide biosynthesis PqqD family chaperone [Emticicia sp. BO119]|uniref:lasso peptide biosynthesis PqqD family chaperone n=1 Tax=Emticicia sp. BO119 TaxID=2757768 RepID=UPI0015F09BCF|nr:lasso peptide biosynthesis PqqD family chaperone [Emticicia sp. BO119]MBA4853985.1 lasso peptide biosynthesis PqqD family chaperone [Emticicia sp. BO119]